jgi:hypothetical protein
MSFDYGLKQGERSGKMERISIIQRKRRKCKMKKEIVSRKLASVAMLLAMTLATAWFTGCEDANPIKSSEKTITLFKIGDAEGLIDEEAKTIRLTVPYGAEDLALTVEVSSGAQVSLKQAEDVSGVSVYRVTAEDGSVQDYTVTVIREGRETISLAFPDEGSINNGDPIVIYKSGEPSSFTLRLETAFTSSEWYVDAELAGTGNSLTLYARNYVPGTHYVSVEFYTGDLLYSREAVFTVSENQ